MPLTKPPRSILLIKPSSLGDVVHALPVAEALKTRWPDAEVSWVVNEEWAEILEGNPFVQHIIPFPRRQFKGVAGLFGGLGWISGLRHLKPDLCIDLQGLLRSGFIARGAGSRYIVGLSDAREGSALLYHATAKVDKNWHAVDRYLSVLEILDIPHPPKPHFQLPEGKRPDSFTLDAPYVLLHPFSRGDGKSLEPEVVRAFCEQWTRCPIVVAGRVSPSLADRLNLPAGTINLLNTTSLTELIWLIRHAAAVVSVDSGPMHMASGITNKLLSIHTWSNPRRVGPYSRSASVWKNGKITPIAEFHAGTAVSRDSKSFAISDLKSIIDWLSAEIQAL